MAPIKVASLVRFYATNSRNTFNTTTTYRPHSCLCRWHTSDINRQLPTSQYPTSPTLYNPNAKILVSRLTPTRPGPYNSDDGYPTSTYTSTHSNFNGNQHINALEWSSIVRETPQLSYTMFSKGPSLEYTPLTLCHGNGARVPFSPNFLYPRYTFNH